MILCYHAVERGWDCPLAVTPEDFEAQCAWLAANRNVVPLTEALANVDDRGRLPAGMTAITFDDGFASTYEEAFPILRRHGLPMTLFIVAETLTPDGREVDWVTTPPPYPLRTVTLEQIEEMRASGLVEIQSHSWAHHDLPELSEDACREDLSRSRDLLEDLLDQPIDLLAYPRGLHDDKVRRAAAAAGYRASFSLPRGPEPVGPQAVPRVGVWPGNSLATLRVKTSRWYLPFRMSPLFPLAWRVLRGTRAPRPGER